MRKILSSTLPISVIVKAPIVAIIPMLCIILVPSCSTHKQPTQPKPAQIFGIKSFSGLRISSDGSLISYLQYRNKGVDIVIEKLPDKTRTYHSLCTDEKCSVRDTEWSHQGNKLAIITQTDTDFSLYIIDNGSQEKLLTTPGIGSQIHWSPDDQHLAALTIAHPHKQPGAISVGVLQVGEITDTFDAQRIAIVDTDSAAPHILQEVSSDKTYVYEYQWTRDNKGFITISANGNGDANWWVATINHIDTPTGTMQVLVKPTMQVASLTVSPDGKSYAVIGGLMSDEIAVGGDVYTASITGRKLHNITPGSTVTYEKIVWKNKGIYATVQDGLKHKFVLLPNHNTNNYAVKLLWDAGTTSGAIHTDDNGNTIASRRQSFTAAPEIYAGSPGHISAITQENAQYSPNVSAQVVSWDNDGFHLNGWLLGPVHPSAGSHPMLIDVHGGPAASQSMWSGYIPKESQELDYQLISQKGYYVFLPDPRGSYGHGERFTQANKRDFGGGDLRDILTGIDKVEKTAPVDDHRLAITGVSYGGYMAMFAPSQTHRFKASIAGAGVSNYISYYGENGINTWLLPYFGASAYDDPGIYRKISPLTYINNYITPTFIYVGEGDIECPPAQSMELFRALQYRHVPTKLVIYPGEGHGVEVHSDNYQDLLQREMSWLDKYVQ